MKPDKYPYIDPMQPHVFDAILRAVNELRKRNKSEAWLLEQERLVISEKLRREAREAEARKAVLDRELAERQAKTAAIHRVPTIIQSEGRGLVLREAQRPKFVR